MNLYLRVRIYELFRRRSDVKYGINLARLNRSSAGSFAGAGFSLLENSCRTDRQIVSFGLFLIIERDGDFYFSYS